MDFFQQMHKSIFHHSHHPLRPLQSMLWIKLPFKKRATILWVMMYADHTEGPQPLGKIENAQMWWMSMCVLCGIVGEWGYSGAERGHVHAWGRGQWPVLWGLHASGHQRDAHANSYTDRDSPQCSSITPLFQAIPFSLGWLGIVSFPHKKLCKSFHPVRWVLGPLTWVDIYWFVVENPHLPGRERRAAWKKNVEETTKRHK